MLNKICRAAVLVSLSVSGLPAFSQEDLGAYLAARQAARASDFAASSQYYTQGLLADPANPLLLENALAAYVALGEFDRAEPIADMMTELGIQQQMSALVRFVQAADNEEWTAIFDDLAAEHSVSPLVDGLIQGWAAFGMGDMGLAVEHFDMLIANTNTAQYGAYNKSLALAAVGDLEGAEALFSAASGTAYSARAAIAHAQVLSQLERNDDAIILLGSVFGNSQDPVLVELRDALEAGQTVPYDLATNAKEGISEFLLTIAELLQDEAPGGYILLYSRGAEKLAPRNTQAILRSAQLLEELNRYTLANEALARVLPEEPEYVAAQLNRIDVLHSADQLEDAVLVAEALASSFPNLPTVQTKLGDSYRRLERDSEAVTAYTRALEDFGENDNGRWVVHYLRAIMHHRIDKWPEAESDFRAALELNPEQPAVLNYLGYSLVERNEKLDEAMGMIERAVAVQPDNGAIVDSLGWVLFQLGRYEESVGYMERAASLEAVDPIVNDHLGDVYWAVGRDIEAVFQWNRALSFDPEEELADRIRKKLKVGLDAVLISEGSEPIRATDDDS